MMERILIIDKDRATRNTLKERLEHEGYGVDVMEDYTGSGDKSMKRVPYSIVLCDNMTFARAIEGNMVISPDLNVIVLTHDGDVRIAMDMIKAGAYDVFTRKPLDMNKLRDSIVKATKSSEHGDSGRNKFSRNSKIINQNMESCIIGASSKIEHLKWLISKVAPLNTRVFVTGENGTGKELVARQIHINSQRSSKPFVEVNCAAIPSELIESELFGHEKGAFTSAIKSRQGKFEQASGGTLFLDEIGDMSLAAQAKMLRALQEHKISRVGSDKDIIVDVRVIAATNKDILKEIELGNFREDLYHRLSVVEVIVPPLKERIDDIPLLVDHFLDQIANEYAMPVKEITPSALKALSQMKWSGNVRELRNVIERLVIFSDEKITDRNVKIFTRL